jgi:Zn-dependent protease
MILSLILTSVSPLLLDSGSNLASVLREIFLYAIYINWGLFIFNLIPLPPLDGSHLLFYPFRKYPSLYNMIYKYGSLLLFGIIIFSVVTKSNLIQIGKFIELPFYGFLHLFGYNI